MPRMGERRQQIAVRLTAEQILTLDMLAASEGESRSDAIRRILDPALQRAKSKMGAA